MSKCYYCGCEYEGRGVVRHMHFFCSNRCADMYYADKDREKADIAKELETENLIKTAIPHVLSSWGYVGIIGVFKQLITGSFYDMETSWLILLIISLVLAFGIFILKIVNKKIYWPIFIIGILLFITVLLLKWFPGFMG